MDLKRKITQDPLKIIVITTLVCSLLFITTSLIYYAAAHYLLKTAEKNVNASLEESEKSINVYVEQKKESLINFSAYLENNQLIDQLDTSTNSAKYDEVKNSIEKGLNSHLPNDLSHVTIISAFNNIVYTTNPQLTYGTQFTQTLYEKNIYVQSFLRSKITSLLDCTVLYEGQRLFVVLTVPIFSKNAYKGAIQVTITTDYLFANLQKTISSSHNHKLLFLAKRDDEVKLISFDPLKKVVSLEKSLKSSAESDSFIGASVGRKGSGFIKDWNNTKAIAAWNYYPPFNIGILVAHDYQTTVSSIIFMVIIWYILLFLLIILVIAIVIINSITREYNFYKIRKFLLLSLLTILLSVLLVSVYKIFLLSDKAQFSLHNQAKSELENTVQQINLYVYTIQSLAYALAADLQTNNYSPEQLEKKVSEILNANTALISITIAYKKYGFNQSIPLYAPMFIKTNKGISKESFSSLIDYTAPESKLDSRYSWYQNALELGAYWSNPYMNENNQLEYMYAIPFRDDNNINGVIAIGFNLLEMTKKINFSVGKHGYSFIINSRGDLIYHPQVDYIMKQKSIFEITRAENNQHLDALLKRMLSKELSPVSLQPEGIHGYYNVIPITQWLMGTIIFEKDAKPDAISYLHNILWTIILSTILSIIVIIICSLILFDVNAKYYISILSTIILVFSIIAVSHFIRFYSLDKANIVPIFDNLTLDQQLNKIEQHALSQNKQLPIRIETGIFIYDFSFKDYGTMIVNAYVWQKYHDVIHKDIPQQVTFPLAYKLRMKEVFRKKEHDYQVIGWDAHAEVPVTSNFNKYPLDTTIASIVLAHPDITKNILLIPDLSSYDKPLTLINGISENELYSSGFYLKDNFFSYQKDVPETTYGVSEIKEQIKDTFFAVNMVLVRNIANPLTLYITPMLVVFLSIFGILYMMKDKMLDWDKLFSAVGAYSATFFSILFIHRSLREAYPVAETLYLEYLFFIAYWGLLVLTLRTVFPVFDRIRFLGVDQKRIPLLYWPLLLIIWYIITIILFYNGSL